MSPEAERLLELLKNGQPHREVYRAQGGGWFVTYGGGETSEKAVRELVGLGLINSVYSTCADDGYHVGKTMDTVATAEERKKHRRKKDAPIIYTDGTRELRR